MQDAFRLCSYRLAQGPAAAGLLVAGKVYPATQALGPTHAAGTQPSVTELLDQWEDTLPRSLLFAERAQTGTSTGVPLAQVELLAPLLYPGTIYCAGANYADHIAEMARVSGDAVAADPRAALGEPWHFVRPSRGCVAGPGARVPRPAGSQKLDWEVELAAVIGAPARHVSVDEALQHVAAYTVAIDFSARDLSRRAHIAKGSPFYFDWLAHKGFEASCPMGPWLTPASAVRDPQQLAIHLDVNGQTMQDSSTSEMIFSVAEQIAHISKLVTLYPGDVVLTGTPAGVGAARGRFLEPGDTVSARIEGLGTLDVSIT